MEHGKTRKTESRCSGTEKVTGLGTSTLEQFLDVFGPDLRLERAPIILFLFIFRAGMHATS